MLRDFTDEINAAFAAHEATRQSRGQGTKKIELPPPRLLFGPYFQPPVEIGDRVRCQRYGLVRVTGWSDGPLPWPQCWVRGPHSLILFADLERAIRSESSLAVAIAWNTTKITLWKFRQALGLEADTKGTKERRSDICNFLLRSHLDDNGRAPCHQLKARKRRATTQHNNYALCLTWQPEVVAQMGVVSDREIARRIGCAALTVARERKRRGIAPLPLGGARQDDLCPIDGGLVAARRWALDLTQAQVSARSHRSMGYISQLEGGYVARVTCETLDHLARALECQPDDLRAK